MIMTVVNDSYLIEVRPRTCLRIRTSSMFKRIRFDDGRERTMTPRMLLAHCDYGYAGTTHKVQGQTSEIHIASLDRNKDAASLYVSATRARDLAPPVQMAQALHWTAGQFDTIDSPREHLRAAHAPIAPRVTGGYGIGHHRRSVGSTWIRSSRVMPDSLKQSLSC